MGKMVNETCATSKRYRRVFRESIRLGSTASCPGSSFHYTTSETRAISANIPFQTPSHCLSPIPRLLFQSPSYVYPFPNHDIPISLLSFLLFGRRRPLQIRQFTALDGSIDTPTALPSSHTSHPPSFPVTTLFLLQWPEQTLSPIPLAIIPIIQRPTALGDRYMTRLYHHPHSQPHPRSRSPNPVSLCLATILPPKQPNSNFIPTTRTA